MASVICRLTAEDRDQLRNPTLVSSTGLTLYCTYTAYLLSYRTSRCRCAAQRWMPAAGVVDGLGAKTSWRVTSTSSTSLQACRVSPHPPPGSAEPPRTSRDRRLDAARSAAEVIINVVIVVNTNNITTVILTLVLVPLEYTYNN